MQIWLIFRDSSYDNSALFGLAIKWPLTFEDDFEFVHLKIDFANSGWWNRLISFRCWMVLSLFLPKILGAVEMLHVLFVMSNVVWRVWGTFYDISAKKDWAASFGCISITTVLQFLVPFWFCLYLDFGVTFFSNSNTSSMRFLFFSFQPKKHVRKQTTSNPQGLGCLWYFPLGKWEEWTRLNTQLPGAGNFSFSTLWGCKIKCLCASWRVVKFWPLPRDRVQVGNLAFFWDAFWYLVTLIIKWFGSFWSDVAEMESICNGNLCLATVPLVFLCVQSVQMTAPKVVWTDT